MTQYIVSEFLFQCPHIDLSAKAKAVMAYLAFRSNKNHTCFPAIKTIAQGCSLSLSSVKRAIKELLGLNLIEKNERYRIDGGQTSNLYTLKEEVLTVTKKDKVHKKKISPELRNSFEDTTIGKYSVHDNNTPDSFNSASDSVNISDVPFSCCSSDDQGGISEPEININNKRHSTASDMFSNVEPIKHDKPNDVMSYCVKKRPRMVKALQLVYNFAANFIERFESTRKKLIPFRNGIQPDTILIKQNNKDHLKPKFNNNSEPPPGSPWTTKNRKS